MAIAAIDAVVGDVMLVAEGNRLLDDDVRGRDVTGALKAVGHSQKHTHEHQAQIDREAGNCIRAAMKNLCHSDFPLVLGVSPDPELMVASRTLRGA